MRSVLKGWGFQLIIYFYVFRFSGRKTILKRSGDVFKFFLKKMNFLLLLLLLLSRGRFSWLLSLDFISFPRQIASIVITFLNRKLITGLRD